MFRYTNGRQALRSGPGTRDILRDRPGRLPASVFAVFVLVLWLLVRQVGVAYAASGDMVPGRWTELRPAGLENVQYSLHVQFLDATTGYALGDDLLYRSKDGGLHWSALSGPHAGWPFFFLNQSQGWVVESQGTPGGPHGSPWSYYLWRTLDGGQTWSKSTILADANRIYFTLVFVNDSTGYLVGVGHPGIGAYILRTTDGGQTWQTYDSHGAGWGSDGILAASFPDRQHGWLVGGWMRGSCILHTGDGGVSWERQYGQEIPEDADSRYDSFVDVSFVDALNGWVVSQDGQILHTADGGTTWKEQPLPAGSHVGRVAFVDPLTGWAAGVDTLLFTADGGVSWTRRPWPIIDSSLFSLQFVDRDHGFAATDNLRILRYTPEAAPNFSDVRESGQSPLGTAVYTLATAGIVRGYADGTFRPDQLMLRAQLAKVLLGALGISLRDGEVTCPFADVPAGPVNDPLYPDDVVAVAAKEGIVQGFAATSFGPFEPATRIQMISMLVRALDHLRPGRLEVPPAGWDFEHPGVSDSAHGRDVALAEYNGLLSYWPGLAWDLWQPATRGEMALMVYAALGADIEPPGGSDRLHAAL